MSLNPVHDEVYSIQYYVIKFVSDFVGEFLWVLRFPGVGFELTTLVVKDTDCTGSCKSNYHTIMMAPVMNKMETRLT